MTSQELSVRLQSLSEAYRETLGLISRLSKLPTQPGGTTSPTPDGAETTVELSAVIHQSLKEQEEEFEIVRQEVEDLTNSGGRAPAGRRRDSEKGRERLEFITRVERLSEDQKLARAQFRRAQLQAKRNAEAAKRKERELLFSGVQEGGPPKTRKGHEKLSQDEVEAAASNDVTAALKRTHQLMESELSRSQFAHDTLLQSTAALSSLNETYGTLDTLLSSSRSLVSSLLHSQKSDTWYLETAFYILLTTIAWLFFRRVIYGPGWWLVYLPTKLFFRFVASIVKVGVGAFAGFAGTVGGSSSSRSSSSASSSSSLAEAGERLSTSLIVQSSATGGSPEAFGSGMASPPSFKVGAGGHGAKGNRPLAEGGQNAQRPPGNTGGGESISEQVGKMVEDSKGDGSTGDQGEEETDEGLKEGTILRERREDEKPNPKKRMFEENDLSGQGEKPRDEL